MTPVTAPLQPPQTDHFLFVDALRGLAALYVVVYHMVLVPRPMLAVPPALNDLVMAGGSGVALFFVLSAFTLSFSMAKKKLNLDSVHDFYVRRIFRIVPLFLVWLGLSLIRDQQLFAKVPSWKDLLLNVSFLFNFFPGKHEGIVWASWTIGVEMAFYSVFPVVFWYGNSIRRCLFLLALAVAAAFMFQIFLESSAILPRIKDSFSHMNIIHSLPAFIMGLLGFHIYRRLMLAAPPRKYGYLLCVVSLAGLAVLLLMNFSFIGGYWHFYAATYMGLMLGLALAPCRVLVNRVTVFFGKISYSLYLNHPTIIYLLSPVYIAIGTFSSGLVTFCLCLLVSMLSLAGVSVLTHRFIEVPGMALGQSWINRMKARRQLPTSLIV